VYWYLLSYISGLCPNVVFTLEKKLEPVRTGGVWPKNVWPWAIPPLDPLEYVEDDVDQEDEEEDLPPVEDWCEDPLDGRELPDGEDPLDEELWKDEEEAIL